MAVSKKTYSKDDGAVLSSPAKVRATKYLSTAKRDVMKILRIRLGLEM
jgi:hypothetical protein